eukprot:gene7239-biopygen9268
MGALQVDSGTIALPRANPLEMVGNPSRDCVEGRRQRRGRVRPWEQGRPPEMSRKADLSPSQREGAGMRTHAKIEKQGKCPDLLGLAHMVSIKIQGSSWPLRAASASRSVFSYRYFWGRRQFSEFSLYVAVEEAGQGARLLLVGEDVDDLRDAGVAPRQVRLPDVDLHVVAAEVLRRHPLHPGRPRRAEHHYSKLE